MFFERDLFGGDFLPFKSTLSGSYLPLTIRYSLGVDASSWQFCHETLFRLQRLALLLKAQLSVDWMQRRYFIEVFLSESVCCVFQ
jgi:hypothetical protein